ncbi:peptide ABC transporter substrate-binding protein [Hypericibacter adhaerens]|uniref:Peptide ABC transporter substrate-binding protein n=1 Tax=Hypericibacter adhaerens TaxID=2602016 RepID=A0A5J6MYD3_9PROT|nr:ABC transporter substrate-binding protein [Hypericibacter adhaerens]QEX22154.1 peptide ABC transporter substrate-binding protein [Hypericibacter adhaerens]
MTDGNSEKRLGLLASQALGGRLSRRRFIESAMALGITAPAALGLWSSRVEAATPKQGGRFRVGLDDGNTTDNMDPATYNSRFMITLAHTQRNFLTEIAPDNTVTGELAESWDVTPDARKWTLKLRKGVEFHDGKSFDASDAAASLNYHRAESSKSAAKSLLETVTDIRADGKDTLVIELSSGSADLPYLLTDYHLVMLPADGEGKVRWDGKSGTGGYRVDKFQPGVSASLTRFPNYWKEGRAHFDEVQYFAIPDVSARQTGITTNELDAMIECDFKTVHLLEKVPNVAVDEVPTGTFVSLPMQMDVAPFDNPDLRLALKYAIDREATVKKVLNGHGSIGNDHPISPIMPFYDAGLEQRPYDPDKAKFHLKKSGLQGLKLSLSAADVVITGGLDLAVLYAETAKQAGVDIQVVREPNDGYWSDVWLKKPFCLAGWGQRPTPDIIFTLGFAPGAPWNDSHFKQDRFDALLIQARAELDSNKRSSMYAEMQRILRDEGSVVIPFFRNWIYARRANVAHEAKLTANWPLDGARGAERWWFA